MDSLYDYLGKQGVEIGIINAIYQFICNERYDTDTLVIDVCDIGQNGNIFKSLSKPSVIQQIRQYLAQSQRMFRISFMF